MVENNSESFRCDSDRFRPSIDLAKTNSVVIQIDSDKLVENNSESFRCDSDRFRPSIDF